MTDTSDEAINAMKKFLTGTGVIYAQGNLWAWDISSMLSALRDERNALRTKVAWWEAQSREMLEAVEKADWNEAALLDRIIVWDRWIEKGIAPEGTKEARDAAMQIIIERVNRLREALRDIVEAWDWWQRDTVDRCQSVPGEAIAHARAALGEDRE